MRDESLTPSQRHYRDSLVRILEDPVLRVFLWRIIVEDCRVFEESFPINASAYCLLAKQEIGKRLLHDAKCVSGELVLKAEQEYEEMMRENSRYTQAKEE